jgi:hypothetical protein
VCALTTVVRLRYRSTTLPTLQTSHSGSARVTRCTAVKIVNLFEECVGQCSHAKLSCACLPQTGVRVEGMVVLHDSHKGPALVTLKPLLVQSITQRETEHAVVPAKVSELAVGQLVAGYVSKVSQ